MQLVICLLLAAALVLALAGAAWSDLRSRTIPNELTAGIALAAPLWWWANALPLWPAAAIQIAIAAAVFTFFAIAFAMGAMGGGDVKLIGALALWLPWQPALRMLFLMSLLGGALTLLMLALRRRARSTAPIEVPYGVAIACAGIWALGERYLYHFA